MVFWTILEGLGLGLFLVVVCAIAIRSSAVPLVHLYHKDVQARCVELGLTTPEKIMRRKILLKICCLPVYLAYVLVFVYAVNGARGFWPGFWQIFVILSVLNLVDRLFIDAWWVGHTRAWTIPGTEDLKPYISDSDRLHKWLAGTVGFAVVSAALAGLMTLLVH